jgi:CRISPR-associated Csx14 family protein
MASILFATLGESPMVITVVVDLLRARGTAIDEVVVIYPAQAHHERYIDLGYEYIKKALSDTCRVRPRPLPFADLNDERESIELLWQVAEELDACEYQHHTAYLSIAGGRKNMSALLAIMPQFYSCVRGVYHLLNPYEDDPARQHRYTNEALFELDEAERIRRLHPPIEDFKLVELPCESVASNRELRQWLSKAFSNDEPPPVAITPAAESFYGQVFRRAARPAHQLAIHFTQTAYDQYCLWAQSKSAQRGVIDAYLPLMRDLYYLREHRHGVWSKAGTTFHFCKRYRTAERVFFYTRPHPIHLFPQQVEEVVICGFSRHSNETDYDPPAEFWLNSGDFIPARSLADLPGQPVTLLAPLGRSPAVVTQAYELLRTREKRQIARICIIYPQQSAAVRNGARILEQVCQRRGIPLETTPLPVADVDDQQSCDIFLHSLQKVIRSQCTQHPDETIALLISGGRKAMSALTLIAAQVMDIGQVYHTTISDPLVERHIQEATSPGQLSSMPRREQEQALFREDYTAQAVFHLFTVPVLRLAAQPPGHP